MRRRGLRPEHGDLVEVEIDEDGDAWPSESPTPDAPVQPPPGAPAPATSGRGRGRQVRFTVVAAGALAALVVGVNVVDAVRTSSEIAALAEVPGVVRDLPEPPVQMWRVEDAYVLGETEELLLLRLASGGLRAVTAADGTVAWERPNTVEMRAETCHPRYADISTRVDLLVCADDRRAVGLPPEGHRSWVETLDAATGRTVSRSQVEGAVVGTMHQHEDLVVTTVDAAGRLHVISLDPSTGVQAWHHEGAAGMVADAQDVMTNWTPGGVQVTAQDPSDTSVTDLVTLDIATGEPMTGPEGGENTVWANQMELPDGGTASVTGITDTLLLTVRDGDGGEGGDDEGRVRFETEGWPWMYGTDDGSAPEVLVVTSADGAARGLDARTGEVRWESTVDDIIQPLIRVRGLAVVMSVESTAVMDLRSGETLWTIDKPVESYGAVTDGRRVIATVPGDDGDVLVARDLVDGQEVWRMPVASGGQVRGLGSVVLVEGEASVTAFG